MGRSGLGVWVSAVFKFSLYRGRKCPWWRGKLSGWGKCPGIIICPMGGNVQGKHPTLAQPVVIPDHQPVTPCLKDIDPPSAPAQQTIRLAWRVIAKRRLAVIQRL